MIKFFRNIARVIIPRKARHFVWGLVPKIGVYHTYIITRYNPIVPVFPIDEKFEIKILSKKDFTMLEKAYSYRSNTYFNRVVKPRLDNSNWICLLVVDKLKEEIAYVSWVVIKNVDFITDSRIYLKTNQFFLRDAFCVPEYRRQGLNSRMDQERINFCVSNGANEILFQIAGKAHKDQNIIKQTSKYCENFNNPMDKEGLIFLKKNYIVMINKLGIHNDIFSLRKLLIKRIIYGKN
jgi:hypothetical protein